MAGLPLVMYKIDLSQTYRSLFPEHRLKPSKPYLHTYLGDLITEIGQVNLDSVYFHHVNLFRLLLRLLGLDIECMNSGLQKK